MYNKMKILIAYDGSNHADAVLPDLRRAGLPKEAEAMVISIADVVMPSPPAYSYEASEARFSGQVSAAASMAHERALHALQESSKTALYASRLIRSQFPLWNLRAKSYTGSPAWKLIREADDWGADLIVIGAPERSALRRLIRGSVSKRVVAEAYSSVRIARAKYEGDDSPPKLVIGVNSSSETEALVSAVAARDWPAGTEAHLITVLGSSMDPAWKLIQKPGENEWVRANQMLKVSAAGLREAGLKVYQAIRFGDPERVLMAEAERLDADSIFVGSGRLDSPLKRFFFGSVSSAIVARATCSVEVVR